MHSGVDGIKAFSIRIDLNQQQSLLHNMRTEPISTDPLTVEISLHLLQLDLVEASVPIQVILGENCLDLCLGIASPVCSQSQQNLA